MTEEKRSWTLDVIEDPETGDCVIEFNDEILAAVGWQPGDVILWTDNKDGSWTLTKKNTE
jgi:hypothetical protein